MILGKIWGGGGGGLSEVAQESLLGNEKVNRCKLNWREEGGWGSVKEETRTR